MAVMTVLLDAILRFVYPFCSSIRQAARDDEAIEIVDEKALFEAMGIVCNHVDANSTKVCTESFPLYKMPVSVRLAESRLCRNNNRLHVMTRLNGPLHGLSNLPRKIKAVPFASFFFYKKLDKSLKESRERKEKIPFEDYQKTHIILTKYKELLSNQAVVLRVNDYFTMKNKRILFNKEQRQNQGDLPEDRNIMGLFFPSMDPRVRFHVASILYGMRQESPECEVDRITEELGFNDSKCKHPKTIILMFSPFDKNHITRSVIDEIMNRQAKKGQEITFAGFYGSKMRLSHDNRECACCGDLRMLLRISGPSIESWSTFIYYGARDSDIEWQLLDFKKEVKSKQHYYGLVYAPRCAVIECSHFDHPCGNSIWLMEKITYSFPNIQFTGFFENCIATDPLYGYGDLNDSLAKKQGSCAHASIIIIAHD